MTLNQIIARFKLVADNHKQINHFFVGDPVEYLSNGEVAYPALFVEILNGNIDKGARYTNYNFRIWLCDLENVNANAQANEIEVLSDLTQIAEDIVAMMSFTEWQQEFEINTSFNFQYYTEKFEDLVAAVAIDFTVSTRYDSSRCALPTNLTFETPTTMPAETFLLIDSNGDLITDSNGDNLLY